MVFEKRKTVPIPHFPSYCNPAVILKQRTRSRHVSRYKRGLEAFKDSNYDQIFPTNTARSRLDQDDSGDSLDLDANDDEFVVRDGEIEWEEGQLGDQEEAEPEEMKLPAEFRLANTDDVEKLNILLQFIVHLAYDEDFADKAKLSTYFTSALRAFDNRIDTYKHSLFSSQALNRDYTKDLERFPIFKGRRVPAHSECDACRISGRTATYEVTFDGVAYDRRTLRPKPITASSEPEEYAYGALPEQSKYTLGKYCYRKSEIYHKLHHLRWHLFEHVMAEIEAGPKPLKFGAEENNVKLVDAEMARFEKSGLLKSLRKEVNGVLEEAENSRYSVNFKDE
ncbi:hypothetical protein BC937DRAFT_95118 [Endogone sp. FLAS-F59071]|nr:hypothetical protein BC937DRAFT_95118 [Endogone sp. FLAS-F59071]|eukprot:RUS13567.1 hypothetical protein BC937DRAFT_95118 [Endogone sp. FLAS-F59071]